MFSVYVYKNSEQSRRYYDNIVMFSNQAVSAMTIPTWKRCTFLNRFVFKKRDSRYNITRVQRTRRAQYQWERTSQPVWIWIIIFNVKTINTFQMAVAPEKRRRRYSLIVIVYENRIIYCIVFYLLIFSREFRTKH